MKKKTIFITTGILIAVAVFYFIYKNKNGTNKTEYIFSQVKKGTITKDITATGALNAFQTIDVGTQVSGIISKIYVDFNDIVKQGQIIAMIDTVVLVASVTDAEAVFLKTKVLFLQQEKEYERYKELLAKNAVSQSDYDQVDANYLSAKSTLKSAEAQLNRAKINLKYATITAPISGIVISKNVNVGQTVAASFATPTLFTIANDLKKMQLQAKIDEADIGQIKKGQSVKFNVDAYPDLTFSGIVDQIRLQPVTTQNVVNYSVMINVPNPDLKLLPGMTANLSVQVDEHKDVFLVPLSATFFNPDFIQQSDSVQMKTTIWKKCNGKEDGCYELDGIFITPVT
ncbi:MAG: efflux RND transporter periplasmic adaptor subunit, partial [Bacteroidota bacterium]